MKTTESKGLLPVVDRGLLVAATQRSVASLPPMRSSVTPFKGIPLALGTGGKATSSIAKGALLTEDNFRPDPGRLSCKLRQMLDSMLARVNAR